MQWLIILLFVLLSVLAGVKFRALRRARVQGEDLAPLLRELLPDEIAERPRMLLYFYREHCAACRAVTPLVEELSRQDKGVVKLDVRRHLSIARHFGIKSTPSLVLLERGRVSDVHVGTISEVTLQQFYARRNVS